MEFWSCPFVHIAILVRCSLASVAAGFPELVFRHPPTPPKLLWPFFCPIAFQQAGNLFARDKGFQPKETKQRLKDANTAGVPLYIANGKMAIKRTKINGNIRVGINSL